MVEISTRLMATTLDQQRTLRVAPELESSLLEHLAPFGWSLASRKPTGGADASAVRVQLFGPPWLRDDRGPDYVELVLQRSVEPEVDAELDQLEGLYFSQPEAATSEDRVPGPLGCMMLVGVVALSVAAMQLFSHGLTETAEWALVLGLALVVPFAFNRWSTRRQRAASGPLRRRAETERAAILRRALELSGAGLAPASPAPIPRLEEAPPQRPAQRPPRAAPLLEVVPPMSPFWGRVVAVEGIRAFGLSPRRGEVLLTIADDWRVWKGEHMDGPEWGWIDSRGEIHQGSMSDDIDPQRFDLGLDVVARIEGGSCFVGQARVGRLVR